MSLEFADRNLLIGVMAVQMQFIARDQLVRAMNIWLLDKSLSLDQVMSNESLIDGETQRLLVALVDKHISLHAGEAKDRLSTLCQTMGVSTSLMDLPDEEISRTLAFSPQVDCEPDSNSTLPPDSAFLNVSNGMRYRILRPHNSGGLGTVSVARDVELGREVALKEIKLSHADHAESRRRFLIEAEITGCLEHPGIVPVYGLGKYQDGRPYYAMRFIRGESLQHAIERFHSDKELNSNPRQRQLELRKLLGQMVDVCNAMEYAHSRGVLHRDLKPDNIMIGKYGETLVVDWGLAKADDQIEVTNVEEPPLRLLSGVAPSSTQMGQCLGTPAYMSPEQACGRIDLMKATSDVYSLGATLYTLLTGHTAFRQSNLGEMLRHVQSGEFERPRASDPRIPIAVEAICLKAMALKPEMRYASAADLAVDIERWMADESVSACVEPLASRIARWARQHRALVSSLIAGTLASIAILSVSLVFLLAANNRERLARDRANSERERAEENLTVAKQAVSTMLTEVGREELSQFPQLEQTRKKLLGKARSFYDQFLKQRPTDESLRFEWALALRNLAEIDRLVDDYTNAEDRYVQSMTELESLVKSKPDNPIYRRELGTTLNDIGMLVKSRDPQRAETFFDEAIEHQESLKSIATSPELMQETARSFYNRGMIHAEQGKRDLARSDVDVAVGLLQTLLDESRTPDTSLIQELARCYNNLGNILRSSGDHTSARVQFTKAIDLLNENVTDLSGERDLRRELAIYQNNFANVLLADGDMETAEQISNNAIDNFATLAEPLPVLANESANAHHSRGVILSQRQKREEAEVEYQTAIDILERLTSAFPDVSLYHDRLGNALFQLGTMRYQAQRAEDAISLIRKAMVEHQRSLAKSSNEPDFRQHLKNDYVGLALIQVSQGQHSQAYATCVDMEKQFASDPLTLFDVAQLIARCIPIVENDKQLQTDEARQTLAKAYTEHVLRTLQAAIEHGFADKAKLENAFRETGAFFPLRELAAFKEILHGTMTLNP